MKLPITMTEEEARAELAQLVSGSPEERARAMATALKLYTQVMESMGLPAATVTDVTTPLDRVLGRMTVQLQIPTGSPRELTPAGVWLELERAAEARGITFRALADTLGVSKSTLSRWKHGGEPSTTSLLAAIRWLEGV